MKAFIQKRDGMWHVIRFEAQTATFSELKDAVFFAQVDWRDAKRRVYDDAMWHERRARSAEELERKRSIYQGIANNLNSLDRYGGFGSLGSMGGLFGHGGIC